MAGLLGVSESVITSNARVKRYPSVAVLQVANDDIFRDAGYEARTRLYSVASKGNAEDPERSMQSSRSRAKAAVRDIARCNHFGYFFTGTLSKAEIDRYDAALVSKRVQTFLENARVYLKTHEVTGSEGFLRCARHFFAGILTYFKEKCRGAPLKGPLSGCVGSFQIHPSYRKGFQYVLIPELYKDGAIHFHGLCNFGDIRIVRAVNPKTGLPLSTGRGQPIFNMLDWKLGFSTCIPIDENYERTCNYLTKYITKDTDKILGKWYLSSRNLIKKPEIDLISEGIDYDSFVAENPDAPVVPLYRDVSMAIMQQELDPKEGDAIWPLMRINSRNRKKMTKGARSEIVRCEKTHQTIARFAITVRIAESRRKCNTEATISPPNLQTWS